MSSIPPKKMVEDERLKFIKGANEINSKSNVELPWNDPKIREDVKKPLTLVLPESYVIKLKYISEKTNKAQQKIAREILNKGIDALIETLL
jgi:hypothetical protein